MNDKYKGLLIGALAGTLLTGTAAYAGNGMVEALTKQVKMIYNGTEVQAPGNILIHEGRTYAQLSTVGKIMGKPVIWDGKTNTIRIGDNGLNEVVAVYTGGQVTKGEILKFLNVTSLFMSSEIPLTNTDFLEKTLKEYITLKVLASKADAEVKNKAKTDSAARMVQMKPQLVGALADILKKDGLVEADIARYITMQIEAQGVLRKSITDAKLRAEFNAALLAKPADYTVVTVSHILIGLKDASTGQELRKKEDALARANEVRQKLMNGGDFAILAKEYSDDPGSKDSGGTYENQLAANYVEAFKNASVTLPIGTISEPVETEFGYHLMKVSARNVQTFDQAKETLLEAAINRAYGEFTTEQLPGLIKSLKVSAIGN
ncbi:hypothetical protein SY83_02930 [Paenibacillus swuensis]|uniref:PpiC domain-containing protein n=1 Tax=Paenibacillus swuensis TaxID=1178515 RepID=A0A172TEH1_9BACL|nr:peptidylprolyl isomerase [Paenibacillus swuensis]ANE45449.1 hypothetical protein SY83_02930 [Paenibacillus swuensis]